MRWCWETVKSKIENIDVAGTARSADQRLGVLRLVNPKLSTAKLRYYLNHESKDDVTTSAILLQLWLIIHGTSWPEGVFQRDLVHGKIWKPVKDLLSIVDDRVIHNKSWGKIASLRSRGNPRNAERGYKQGIEFFSEVRSLVQCCRLFVTAVKVHELAWYAARVLCENQSKELTPILVLLRAASMGNDSRHTTTRYDQRSVPYAKYRFELYLHYCSSETAWKRKPYHAANRKANVPESRNAGYSAATAIRQNRHKT
jgi:hypothetical protein